MVFICVYLRPKMGFCEESSIGGARRQRYTHFPN
jgi:hypothetical protein